MSNTLVNNKDNMGEKMDIEKIREEIIESDTNTIYRKYLNGNEVWYFKVFLNEQNYSNKYDEFKHYVNDKLKIRFNEIAIFGSAKCGFSLSPGKNLSLFHEKSDIDLALVSKDLYIEFWDEYLKKLYSGEIVSYNKFAKGVFRKFIELEQFPEDISLYREWEKLADVEFYQYLQFEFGIAHDINYRIFESWDAVESYYKAGISELKRTLEVSI